MNQIPPWLTVSFKWRFDVGKPMKPVRVLILRTAGTNCECETAAALEGSEGARHDERPDDDAEERGLGAGGGSGVLTIRSHGRIGSSEVFDDAAPGMVSGLRSRSSGALLRSDPVLRF